MMGIIVSTLGEFVEIKQKKSASPSSWTPGTVWLLTHYVCVTEYKPLKIEKVTIVKGNFFFVCSWYAITVSNVYDNFWDESRIFFSCCKHTKTQKFRQNKGRCVDECNKVHSRFFKITNEQMQLLGQRPKWGASWAGSIRQDRSRCWFEHPCRIPLCFEGEVKHSSFEYSRVGKYLYKKKIRKFFHDIQQIIQIYPSDF